MTDPNERKQSIAKNLAVTVSKDDLELPAQILEFTIDQIVDDGILKDIPFVGWIAKGLSVGQSISDRILFHKIIRFIVALERYSKKDRDDFRNKLEHDSSFEKSVGEHLLIVLNKIDVMDKASLLAQCFSHFLNGTIDHEYFIDLSGVIERSSFSDLQSLKEPRNKTVRFKNVGVAVSSGILVYGMYKTDDGEVDIGNKFSAYGEDLRNIFLDGNPDRYLKEIERKEKQERSFAIMKEKHTINRREAVRMKKEGATDEEIIEELGIRDKYILDNYLKDV